MSIENESLLIGYPNLISYDCTLKILEQMTKSICKIKIGQEQGTGFFCKIPFPNKNNMLPVLITNNHVINGRLLENDNEKVIVKIKEENENKKFNLKNRKKYTNKEYDVTIIEIKEDDGLKDKNYLDLDENIINDILIGNNKNIDYEDETIYLLQHPGNKLSVSYGIVDKIYEDKIYNFNHKCSTEKGSSGSPILNLNNKVIGIHKQGSNGKKYNIGSFLNYPIKEFIELNKFNNKYNLQINDISTDKLNLKGKLLGNEFLEDLNKFKFLELKELYLNNNNIIDIKSLEKNIFDKLKILDLSYNKITNIDSLKIINFKELKQLYLNNNNITDIKIFEDIKFNNLEILDLSWNKIDESKFFPVISKLESQIKDFRNTTYLEFI